MERELDARVAVEIMGWTRPPNRLSEEEQRRCTRAEWVEDKRWKAPNGMHHKHPPAYSSEWAAVGELLAMLDAADWTITLCNQVAGRCWGATINTGSAHGTFPEAVCRAALKAKEARNGAPCA